MRNLAILSWLRVKRRGFWLLIIGVAIVIGTVFFGVTQWQLAQENETIIVRLERGSDELGWQLRDTPPKPAKIPKQAVTYWRVVDAKQQMLVAMHHASQAKKDGNEQDYTRWHATLLAASAQLDKYVPNGAAEFTTLDIQTIKRQLKRDRYLLATGQTVINSIYSLAPRAVLTRLFLFLLCPPILIFLLLGLNWLWRDSFDTKTHQFLLLHVRQRSHVMWENLVSTIVLMALFSLICGGTTGILAILLGGKESVAWSYPLTPQTSLGVQAAILAVFAAPIVWCLTAGVQAGTLLLHHISTRIAVLVIVSAGITFLPFGISLNPFAQLGYRLLDWQQPLNIWALVPLLIVAASLTWAVDTLLNRHRQLSA